MHLLPNEFYHIYNRGNNKQQIFFRSENYIFFIKKIRAHLLPVSDIIAFCLMPNHFHLIIHANDNTIKERKSFGGKPMQEFAYQLGLMQSSYAQAIKKQNHTSGSLFQQKSKAKLLIETSEGKQISYLETCFFYVHYNPTQAGLVNGLSEWAYSSFPDYFGERKGTLCNKQLFFETSGFTEADIKGWSKWDFPDDIVGEFF